MAKFKEDEYKKSNFSLGAWIKIFNHLGKNKKYLYLSLFFVFITSLLTVLLSVYISDFITIVTDSIENGEDVYLDRFVAVLLILTTCFGISTYIYIRLSGLVDIKLSYTLRKKAFIKLQELPFEFYDRRPVGWLIARMTSDAAKLSETLSTVLIDFIEGFFVLIIVMIVMFIINVQIALYALSTLPVILLVSYIFRKIILNNQRKLRRTNSIITGKFAEGISGAVTSKTLSRETENLNEFNEVIRTFRKTAVKSSFINSMYNTFIVMMFGVAIGTIYYVMGNDASRGLVSIGEITLFITLLNKFFDPIQVMSRKMVEFQEGQASAERIISLIEEVPSIKDTDEVIEKYGTILNNKVENFEKLHGDIEFKNVGFKYSTGETILSDFDLKIKKGTSVALVGETGAGKSTIINLLCRFYEPTSGSILIDGKDYKERSQSWLHSNLGYVLQSPQLFTGNVLENIRYGKLDATDEEVIDAAKYVGAHEFINNLDKKYLTEVGEGGGRLSVGEKQLISFARAILKDPAILILDEATSSIDTQTEHVMQQSIEKLLKDRTSFSIAHRLSTIEKSDLILVLQRGNIVESGSHSELLKLKGYYYNLHNSQFEE